MNVFDNFLPLSPSMLPADDDPPPDLLITAKPPWDEDAVLDTLLPVLSFGYQFVKKDFSWLAQTEISLLLSDDAAIAQLNKAWRGKDGATNVLAFAQFSAYEWTKNCDSHNDEPHHSHPVKYPLGDIVISYETCKQEADSRAIPLTHHTAHLFIHGFLHLLGLTHDNEIEGEKMQAIETAILQKAKIPDPYQSLI